MLNYKSLQAFSKEAGKLYATETPKYCENTANPYDRPAAGNKYIFADIQGIENPLLNFFQFV